MEKQYFIKELEYLRSIPEPVDFVQSLIIDFEEIVNRVLPWENDNAAFVGMLCSKDFKGAFIVTPQKVRIYREEFPAYYMYLRNTFHPAICVPHSTMN